MVGCFYRGRSSLGVSANGECKGAPFGGGRGGCGVCVKLILGGAGGSGVCSG
jgi:hypothetical protein